MQKFISQLTAFIKDEEGASAIEYALIAALIALAISVGAKALGGQLNTTFNTIVTKLAAALQ
jgi:pilus assembly protein Flp/PilA